MGSLLPTPPNLGFNVYFFIRMPAAREPPGTPDWVRGLGGAGELPVPAPPLQWSEAPRPRPSVDPARPEHIYFLSEQLIPPRESRILERRFENSDPRL